SGISCPGARTALSAWLGHWRTERADKAVRAPIRVGSWPLAGFEWNTWHFMDQQPGRAVLSPPLGAMNFHRGKWSRAATGFGARNLFRFNACWPRGAKSLQSLCAVRGLMRTEVRAPLGSGSTGFDVRCFDSGLAASQGILVGEGASLCSRGGCAPRKSERAFSLIELIGVLAVIAILAAVLAPALIRQMDRIAGDQESASLKSFGDALQQ